MAITEERHILKMVCAFLMICAFGLLLGCENIVPIQCFVNQFGFRASRKGTEQFESVVCAFADGNADPDSFFFLLVHNGIFFVRLVCCVGLMLYLCAVWNKCVIPILLRVRFLCWEHFAPSFFVRMDYSHSLISIYDTISRMLSGVNRCSFKNFRTSYSSMPLNVSRS